MVDENRTSLEKLTMNFIIPLMPAILAVAKAAPGVIAAWTIAFKKYQEGTLTEDDVFKLESVINHKESDIADA